MKRSLIVAALLAMMTVQSIFAIGALFARRPGTNDGSYVPMSVP